MKISNHDLVSRPFVRPTQHPNLHAAQLAHPQQLQQQALLQPAVEPHDPLNGFQSAGLPGLDLMSQLQAILGRFFGGAAFPQDAAGHTLVSGGAQADRIEVRPGPMGGAYVTSNGVTSYLTAEEAKELHITAGAGNDQVFVDPNFPYPVTIDGGAGDDILTGGRADDVLRGGDGRDVIVGNRGNDQIDGGHGDDVMVGGHGDDVIRGGQGRDWAHAGYGNDTVYGGRGNDRVHGGAGNDRLFGNSGADVIHGDGGNDLIRGGRGSDRLFGGFGNDRIFGDAGDDRIRGGRGIDVGIGGPGNDDVRLY
jgi:Ca2+-binding RTX toxin-like protein